MGSRWNHEKLNHQVRASRSKGDTTRDELPLRNFANWEELRLGRHKGKTIPQLMFEDLSWFSWAYGEGVFLYYVPRYDEETRNLEVLTFAQQAYSVGERAKHIVKRGYKCAHIVDEDGVYAEFVVIKDAKSAVDMVKLKPGSKLVRVTRELDLTIPLEFANSKLGFEHLVRCFRKSFLPRSHPSNHPEDNFFRDRRNFNMDAIKEFRTLVPNPDDAELLKEKYFEKQKREGRSLGLENLTCTRGDRRNRYGKKAA
jgi:hypothetical protein